MSKGEHVMDNKRGRPRQDARTLNDGSGTVPEKNAAGEGMQHESFGK
jgi:hypothetical protein